MENMSSIFLETYWNISYSDQEEIIPVINITSADNFTTTLTYRFILLGPVVISCYSQVRTEIESSNDAFDSIQLQVIGKS